VEDHGALERRPARPRDRDGREEGARIRVLRLGIEPVRRSELDDLAEVHDRHAVAHVTHDREIVSDERECQAELVAQVLQEVQHLRLDRDVERRDGLVGDGRGLCRDQRVMSLPSKITCPLVGSGVRRPDPARSPGRSPDPPLDRVVGRWNEGRALPPSRIETDSDLVRPVDRRRGEEARGCQKKGDCSTRSASERRPR
jgi:hypothetical protein